MAYLDEIAAILEGSSQPLYPLSSGSYWIAVESTDTGLYFQESTTDSGLVQHTTSAHPTGIVGHSSGSYIAAFGNAAGGNSGWRIYRGHLPDSTVIGDKAVALINTPGEPEWEGAPVEPRGLQIVVRGEAINQTATGYEDAMDEAVRVRDALHEYAGLDPTGATHYPGIWNLSGPFFAGFDEGYRPHLSANFRVLRQRAS